MKALVYPLVLLGLWSTAGGQCLHLKKPVSDAAAMAKWVNVDYSLTPLKDGDLQPLSEHRLAVVRGIIFGRHGRIFKEQEIQDYLWKQPWYHADSKFTNDLLNDMERANLDKVRLAESAKHKHVQPGDLRYWTQRKFPAAKVKGASILDDHIMRAEIEAIHGKSFPDQPSLQSYFEDRYWYKADPKYNARSLNRVERANMAILAKAEQQIGGKGIHAEDLPAFQNQPLPADALNRTSLTDLRLLRNGFYALHGREFHTDWLYSFFAAQEWYKTVDHPTPLNPIEHDNVLKIVKREGEIHQSLGQVTLTKTLVGSMQLEDVRNLKNEIYARHGKVFKTKWLESYFASLPWYKPNPDYSDALLNGVEKKNTTFLAQMQTKLQKAMSMEEG